MATDGRMYFYVESSSVEETKGGGKYLKLMVNTGKERTKMNLWKYEEGDTFAAQFIETPPELRKDETYNSYSTNYTAVEKTEQDSLPDEHPLRSLKLKGDYDSEALIQYIETLTKKFEMPEVWVDFLLKHVPALIKDYDKYPAGKAAHHPWLNGLSTHTMEVLQAYEGMASTPYFSNLKHHVAITALVFHDFGKMKEYEEKNGAWESTRYLPAIGHIYLSAHTVQHLIESKIGKIKNLPAEQRDDAYHIIHCILAHHGKLEYGSPVLPASKEAYLVHTADLLSATNYQFDETGDMQRSWFLGCTVLKTFDLQ